ncbi:hypothetical protein [Clostridium perfringens]|uniref:hypothetical protein n=1 Tax=Clostridium perfringens TaxID=1502 RepID=UPI001E3D677F|nr:hypothetical protein [Clostridium perfringens]MCC5421378.1 hypothetical protein [Clostridium perfringens]MCC5430816.1 hypothetical protein [Clostridium perfringens]MCC5445308.1 hypothetical protein [Clostridium perfringens]MCC5448263.1 hypothetical protein [Clostridium perfringens]MDK0792747.1 hypothetical protein [Clostridium perfringens]
MERQGKFIKIPNKMIVGEETLIKKYGDKALIVYIYLENHRTLRDNLYISLSNCIEECGYKPNKKKGGTNEQFRNILIEFKNEGIIETDVDLEKVKINDLIHCTMKEVDDKFFTIYDCELDKIIDYEEKEDKLNILKVFAEIECRRHKNGECVDPETHSEYEVSFPSYKQICLDTLIASEDSIKKYIDILVKLNIIIVGNNGDRINTITGEVKRDNNTYALANDRGESSLRGALRLFKQKNEDNGWKYKNFKDNRVLAGEKTQILKAIKENRATIKQLQRLKEINNILGKDEYKTTEQEEREIEELL